MYAGVVPQITVISEYPQTITALKEKIFSLCKILIVERARLFEKKLTVSNECLNAMQCVIMSFAA